MKGKRPKKNKRKSNSDNNKKTGKTYTGTLDVTKHGAGYVICENLERDIFIPQDVMNGGLHGDLVEVLLIKKYNPDKKPKGKIIKILERKNTKVIGIIKETHFGK
jgi:exoribonuclease R